LQKLKEQLNELRKKKFIEYNKIKTEIAEKHQEYLSKLKIDEEKLLKIIDDEIKLEQK
jgi:hypothetical protein